MSILKEIKQQYIMGGVTEKLIYWNVALFAIPFALQGILSLFTISFNFLHYVNLSSHPGELIWKPWSILTYSFFHEDFFHILFNLLILNFCARLFLTFFKQKQLLSLYLMGGIFSGLIFIIGFLIFPRFADITVPLIGSSGAVMAVLFGVTTYAPQLQVRLLLIGNVKLWHIAIVLFFLDLIRLSGSNAGGHIAHLGGALFGYLYASQLKKGTDITKGFTSLMDSIINLFKAKKNTPFKKVHKNTTYTKPKPSSKDKSQQQIDEILDKISKSGYDSLTKDEKEFLFKAGKS
ncbi:rhomboid family intramembrane serine protease [Flavobacterium sp.]|jgi:membrane associated rhomboid family serine protease|uniref:rhomboid family intramembrane serine protease n=1 Tax=Flavobacterium sp. TaxID=239 RepID=UPI0037BFEBF0